MLKSSSAALCQTQKSFFSASQFCKVFFIYLKWDSFQKALYNLTLSVVNLKIHPEVVVL